MKEIISTDEAPAAIGPYSQAIRCGNLVFCSGQIPLDASGRLVTGSFEAQARRVLDNLVAVLKSSGLGPSHVVKTTIFLIDLNDFAKTNEIYGEYFGHEPPARSTVQVSSLPRGARIEIEAIAIAD